MARSASLLPMDSKDGAPDISAAARFEVFHDSTEGEEPCGRPCCEPCR